MQGTAKYEKEEMHQRRRLTWGILGTNFSNATMNYGESTGFQLNPVSAELVQFNKRNTAFISQPD